MAATLHHPARAALIALCAAAGAAAADCPPGGDAAAEARAIDGALRAEARRGRVWYWGWIAGYAALTAGQAIPIPLVDDRGARADLGVGAATAAVGLLATAIAPPAAIAESELAAGRLAAAAPGDACAALAGAREAFARAAADEAFARGPWMHAANAALNLGAGLVLGLGWGRWLSGALTAGSGLLVGELQLWTAPSALLGGLPDGAPAGPSARAGRGPATPRVAVTPWAFAGGGGLAVTGAF